MISKEMKESQDRFLLAAIVIAAVSTLIMVNGLVGSGPHPISQPFDTPQTIQ